MQRVPTDRRVPTKDQLRALKELYDRYHPEFQSFLRFRRNAFWDRGMLIAPWHGMYVGIEYTGLTHM